MRKVKNPLHHLWVECTTGTMEEKAANPRPAPIMLDVELTNRCNFRCVMCPTGQRTVKRSQGYMDIHLLGLVLDQARNLKIPVRFIRWGEPLLHPDIINVIYEVKYRNVICHINTNGSLLDRGLSEFFVRIGLDSIKFSFQGINMRTYEMMRNCNNYHKLMQKIKVLHKIREDLESDKPFIQIGTTITNEPDYAVDLFKRKVDNFTDAVYIGVTRDLQETVKTPQKYCECPEVFDKLSINYDGSVSACCGDYDNYTIVGNLNEQTILEIWNGQPLADFRMMLRQYRHNENYLCSRCARSDRE